MFTFGEGFSMLVETLFFTDCRLAAGHADEFVGIL